MFKRINTKQIKISVKKHRNFIIFTLGLVVVALLIALIATIAIRNNKPATVVTPTNGTTAVCSASWAMKDVPDSEKGPLVIGGIPKIDTAVIKADAVEAVNVWVEKVKRAPNVLVLVPRVYLDQTVNKADLVDKNGCATAKAEQIVDDLLVAIGKANVEVSNAPESGLNSSIENGVAVRSNGVTGNRKAIHITFSNGKEIWILAICGNIVTPPSVTPLVTPPVTPPPVTPLVTPPVTPPVTLSTPPLEAKDPTKDVGANPAVAAWKKDDTGGNASNGHQVSTGDGATVSNGLQTNPVADAAKAAADAAAKNAANEAAAAAARAAAVANGGGTVDSNESHTVSAPTPSDW